MSDKKTLKVKLVRSPIGCKASHRATVVGLGLRRVQAEEDLRRHGLEVLALDPDLGAELELPQAQLGVLRVGRR